MIERLETERLVLRKPKAEDWPAVQEFWDSDRSAMLGGPMDQGRAWRVFAGEIGHWDLRGYGMFAVTEKGSADVAVGLVGPWYPVDWPETEIGWMMFGTGAGRGYATEAARACVRHVYEDLGWDTAVSYILPENVRSIGVAERAGASLDPDAPQPRPDKPCLVFRHPRPEAAS